MVKNPTIPVCAIFDAVTAPTPKSLALSIAMLIPLNAVSIPKPISPSIEAVAPESFRILIFGDKFKRSFSIIDIYPGRRVTPCDSTPRKSASTRTSATNNASSGEEPTD